MLLVCSQHALHLLLMTEVLVRISGLRSNACVCRSVSLRMKSSLGLVKLHMVQVSSACFMFGICDFALLFV